MNKQELENWHKRSANLTKDSFFYKNAFLEFCAYEADIPKGPVLDIGCGLGFETLYFANQGRKVTALDNEKSLLERVAVQSRNIKPVLSQMPDGEIPGKNYALCIVSNVLHFMDMADSYKLCQRVGELVMPNGYIAVRAHSTDHPYADPQHSKHNKIVHFFSRDEIQSLFDSNKFSCLYLSKYERLLNRHEVELFGYDSGQDYYKGSLSMLVQKI